MSERFPGGIITKSPATPTGPYQTGAAPGIWTLDQQLQYQQQGIWPTAGLSPPYIEDVFSTWLYTGVNSTLSINNGIDLSGKGGMVWIKQRNLSGYPHNIFDTVRGATYRIFSDSTSAQSLDPVGLTAFNSNGFTVGNSDEVNFSGNLVSWTFRKQSKFFDVQTATKSGGIVTFNHNLGVAPGMVLVKCTNTAENWLVYHQSLGVNKYLFLNATDAAATYTGIFTTSSTQFSLNSADGTNYVAYLFAHNAGGFGLTGTDNVISCGSYYNSGSAPVNVTLGYEPQWILIKKTDSAQNWFLMDTMRGDSLTAQNLLKPNTSDAETVSASAPGYPAPTATGFTTYLGAEGTFIYIAIRRGPMKVPTDATKVFLPTAFTSNNSGSQVISVGFPSDMALVRERTTTANYASNWPIGSRLTGNGFLRTTLTNAEVTFLDMVNGWDDQNSIDLKGIIVGNGNLPEILYNFQRAPGFFDVVCFTSTGNTATRYNHNLAAIPQLIIIKSRSSAFAWFTYCGLLSGTPTNQYLKLNTSDAVANNNYQWGFSAPTSTDFSAATSGGDTYVAYLFATCPGVSKVGSYTGNGTTQTINCGFTGGARFVLIKRTDATGDWYTYDTARGMTVLTDPYLWMNSANAEVATLGSVTTVSTGFALNSAILADINVSAGTYIFLAIA